MNTVKNGRQVKKLKMERLPQEDVEEEEDSLHNEINFEKGKFCLNNSDSELL